MILNHLSDAPLTDFQKEDLGTVYRSGLRALTLMNGLIDIARLNRKETKYKLDEVEIQGAFEESLAQWKKFHPSRDAHIETLISTNSATLQADEQLLRQIISIFISYVSEFTEADTSITILVAEEAGGFVFTFTSIGTKAKQPAELDLELNGYLGRAFVELNGGEILNAEENDRGAEIQFMLPKVNPEGK